MHNKIRQRHRCAIAFPCALFSSFVRGIREFMKKSRGKRNNLQYFHRFYQLFLILYSIKSTFEQPRRTEFAHRKTERLKATNPQFLIELTANQPKSLPHSQPRVGISDVRGIGAYTSKEMPSKLINTSSSMKTGKIIVNNAVWWPNEWP